MGEPPSIVSLSSIISIAINVGVAGILLLLAALLAAADAACFSISPEMMRLWSKSSNSKEQLVVTVAQEPLMLRITLSMSALFIKVLLVTQCLLLSPVGVTTGEFIILLTLTLVLLEIMPRTYARKNAVRLSKRLAPFIHTVLILGKPVTGVILRLRARWKTAFKEKKPSREELALVLELAAANDKVVANEKEILRGIVNFGSLTVTDLMKHRDSISAISVESTFDDLISHINRCGFSRIPVYKKNIDQILGVIYVKDLLPFLDNSKGFKWPSILRPGFFVTKSKKIDLLLKDFQEKRVHMAIVKDESGKTAGLITLEDLIEEIIGEINDENDVIENSGYRKIDETTFVFDGKTPIHEFFSVLDQDPPFYREPEEHESLEDFIIEFNDELPAQGDELVYEQLTFVIEAVEQKRIKRVRVNVHAQA